MAAPERKLRTPWRRRWRLYRSLVLPACACAVALALLLALVWWRRAYPTAHGYAEPAQTQVFASQDAVVQALNVERFERVAPGDAVAALAPGPLREQAAQLLRDISELKRRINTMAGQWPPQVAGQLRDCAGQLDGWLGREIDAFDEPFAAGSTQAPECAVSSAVPEAARFADELGAIRTRVRLLSQQRAALVLRAPAAGLVTSLERRPGQFAAQGAPILTLHSEQGRYVRVYLPEADAGRIAAGMAATAQPSLWDASPVPVTVMHIGASGNAQTGNTANNLQLGPAVDPAGVPVLLGVLPDGFCRPGEPLTVTFHHGALTTP